MTYFLVIKFFSIIPISLIHQIQIKRKFQFFEKKNNNNNYKEINLYYMNI